jgi:CHASE3 domain sensor protein
VKIRLNKKITTLFIIAVIIVGISITAFYFSNQETQHEEEIDTRIQSLMEQGDIPSNDLVSELW